MVGLHTVADVMTQVLNDDHHGLGVQATVAARVDAVTPRDVTWLRAAAPAEAVVLVFEDQMPHQRHVREQEVITAVERTRELRAV